MRIHEASRVKLEFFASLILIALLILSSGCGVKPGAKGPIKIGVVLSMTGNYSQLGLQEMHSIRLFEEKLNKHGGIKGRKVQFIIEDDESDPAKASEAVSKLIKDYNVIAIIGGSSTSSTLSMKPIVEKKEIPLISLAAGTKITKPLNKWIFRVAPTNAMAIQKIFDYIKNVLKARRIAILHDRNAFGTLGSNETKSYAQKEGIQIVSVEDYGSADTDMKTQLERIERTSAQAILVWGTDPGPAIIARNIQELGIRIPHLESHGIASKEFIELAGSASNGVVFPAGRLLLPETITDPMWKDAIEKFRSEYKKKYKTEISTFAAHGYDAALIVTEALRRNSSSREALRDEIEKTKGLVGIDGVFNYTSKNHDGLSPDYLIMIKIVNGMWTPAE